VPELGQSLPDVAQDLGVQGVAGVGAVYGDPADPLLDRRDDRLVLFEAALLP